MTDGHLHPTTQTASPYQQHQSPTSKVSNITPFPSMCWTRPMLALCSNPCWQDIRFKFHHHIWPRISPNPCSKFFLLISSKLVLYIYARIMLVANPSNQFNAQHCVNPCSHKQRPSKQLPSLLIPRTNFFFLIHKHHLSPTDSHANQSSRMPPHVFHEQSQPQSTSKTLCKGG